MIISRKDAIKFNEWYKFKDCKLSYILIYKFSENVQFCAYHLENSTQNVMQLYINSSYLLHCCVSMWILQLIWCTLTLQVISTYFLYSPNSNNFFSTDLWERNNNNTESLTYVVFNMQEIWKKTKLTTNRSE